MKKKAVLTVFLLFVFLAFNSSCKSKEDEAISILGNWSITMIYSGSTVYSGGTITFAGSLLSGSVSVRFPPSTQTGTGTFTVSESTVHFTVYWPDAEYTDTCTGTVVNDNSMNGTLVEQPGNTNGTWNCTR
jgi:hypothetical protein